MTIQANSTKRASQRDIAVAARRAAKGLRGGTLTLRQVLGLTDEEMAAIAQAADQYRQRGQLQQAASIYGLLIAHDPLKPGYWEQLAGLQQRMGQHLNAVICFEALAMLSDRNATNTYREAESFKQLDRADLARNLTTIARSLTSGSEPSNAQLPR